jgi:putative transposase
VIGSATLQRRVQSAPLKPGFSRKIPLVIRTYFITASAYMHQNLFQRNETADLLLSTIFAKRDADEFEVHEFVIMPNHIHLLITVEDDRSIGRAIQLIKGGFSHAIGQAGLKLKAVWQPSYYEHRVRDADEYERIRSYIRENPVRRGFVAEAADYPYSSAKTNVRLDEVPDRLKPGIGELAVTRR